MPVFAIQHTPCNAEPDLINRDTQKPEKYKIGFWLMDIGAIDHQSGSYELDFWTQISPVSKEHDLTEYPPPKLIFLNGRIEHITGENCRPSQYEYLVQGRFFNNMEFKEYPFQKIELAVRMESATPGNVTYVEFEVEPTAGIDEAVNIPGWNLSDVTFEIVIHNYPEEGPFNRFEAIMQIESYPLQSFMKNIFPVVILVSISLISMWIPKNYTARIYLTMPPLLALVFWHIGTINQLPILGYLTIFDQIMIASYAVLLNCILSIGIQMKLDNEEKYDKAKKINRVMRYFIPVLGFGIFLILYSV